jgi:preprotein translocase subunit SecD
VPRERRARKALLTTLGLIAFATAGCGSTNARVPTTSEDAFVVLQVQSQNGRPVDQEDLVGIASIIRNRAKALGTDVVVQSEGRDRIVVRFPGRRPTGKDSVSVIDSGVLEFYDLETSLSEPSTSAQGFPVEHTSLYQLLAGVQSRAATETSTEFYVFGKKTKKLVAGPFAMRKEAAKPLRERDGELLAVPHNMVLVTCAKNAMVCPGANGAGVPPTRTYYYLFKYDPPEVPQMTGEDLKPSGTRADYDSQTGQPIVTLQFTADGAKKFKALTAQEWTRGKIKNAPQHFAVVLDRELRTFPQIDYTDGSLSRGIGGRWAQIEDLESMDEARNIAVVLETGALPFRLRTIESHL